MTTIIARRVLTMRDGRQVKPGEPVPEFHEWSEVVQNSHLNLGWVERVKDFKAPKKQRKANTVVAVTAEKATVNTVSPPEEAIKCHMCGKEGFTKLRFLKSHIAVKHSKPSQQ